MAVEIGKLIAETLAQLPEDHPDRKFLAGQLKVFEAFNVRSNSSKDIPLPQGHRIEVTPKLGLRRIIFRGMS